MKTSLSFNEIKSIRLEVKDDVTLQVIKVRGGALYEAKSDISFGMNAIFGQFEAILDDKILQILKT